jgi:SPP1 family predicted phage head-tail adaptor
MKSGSLRHYLNYQNLVSSENSDGETEEAWVDAFNQKIPTGIAYLSGRELISANAEHSQVVARLTVRYDSRFNFKQRAISNDGTIFNIEAVLPDLKSGKEYLTLLASYGLNDG